MRNLRSRLNILLYLLVIFTSIFSLVIVVLKQNGILFQREAEVRMMLFGYAAKDILLLLVAVLAVVILVTFTNRSTTNPIRELSRATREVAKGNFDVTVYLNDRITEFGELEQNFNRMTAELRANEYLRKDFISNVSHQLKTPLSVLRGYSDLLKNGNLSEAEQKEFAAYISHESERLTRLVDDMLRLSRIDHQEIAPVNKTFALGEDLRQAVLEMEPRLAATGIELDADIEDVDFSGDPELLHQVWINLLDNAVKFTPAGGCIRVRLALTDTEIHITVADNGPEMDSETLERLFEQFYRGNTDKKTEGSGLGLPLALRICTLHGGTIRAANNHGVVFSVTLPLPEEDYGELSGILI